MGPLDAKRRREVSPSKGADVIRSFETTTGEHERWRVADGRAGCKRQWRVAGHFVESWRGHMAARVPPELMRTAKETSGRHLMKQAHDDLALAPKRPFATARGREAAEP